MTSLIHEPTTLSDSTDVVAMMTRIADQVAAPAALVDRYGT